VALVVNAHPVKQVPGRKTDIADAQWLAMLVRSGWLKGGFVPPQNLREWRLVSRQMQKFTAILAGEKNRLHKVLTDGGIRLSAVVSDSHGSSARAMIKGLLAGETPEQVLSDASKRLKASDEELRDALAGELSDTHRFVLCEILAHSEELEARLRFPVVDALPARLPRGRRAPRRHDPVVRHRRARALPPSHLRRAGGGCQSRYGRGRPHAPGPSRPWRNYAPAGDLGHLVDAPRRRMVGHRETQGAHRRRTASRRSGRALLERTASLWNMHGPTETTIWSSAERINDPD
jgi:hypothetical protein